MLAKKEENTGDIFEDWPASYYRQKDPRKRREYLEQRLAAFGESAADLKRKQLLNKRFSFGSKEPADLFIRAWMMIRIGENDTITFFNRRSKEKELRENLKQLCILNEDISEELLLEWRDFALKYLIICCESHSYRTAGFGLIRMNDEKAAFKIAAEIDLVTRVIPSRFHLEEECSAFRDTVIDVYCSLLENGEEYWRRYTA